MPITDAYIQSFHLGMESAGSRRRRIERGNRMRRAAWVLAAVLAIALLPGTGVAQQRAADRTTGSDVRELNRSQHPTLRISKADRRIADATVTRNAAPPVVGDQRVWLAL